MPAPQDTLRRHQEVAEAALADYDEHGGVPWTRLRAELDAAHTPGAAPPATPRAIHLTTHAGAQLRALNSNDYPVVRSTLHALAQEPRPAEAKPLGTGEEAYRVDAGRFHLLYSLRAQRTLVVAAVVPR